MTKIIFFFLILCLLSVPNSTDALSITLSSSSPQVIADFMVQRSDLVVVGTLESQFVSLGSYPGMDQGLTINTEWKVNIETLLKGTLKDQSISLIVPGGCLPDKNLCFKTSVFPKLKMGEKVLLFLKPTENGSWFVFNIMHGFQWEKGNQFQPLGLTLQKIKNIIGGDTR